MKSGKSHLFFSLEIFTKFRKASEEPALSRKFETPKLSVIKTNYALNALALKIKMNTEIDRASNTTFFKKRESVLIPVYYWE